MVSQIDTGAYERHVRRIRGKNERRRAAPLDAIVRWMPDANAGRGIACPTESLPFW
jgi:GntR family transcriptional regulator/MocR family aminotransferase